MNQKIVILYTVNSKKLTDRAFAELSTALPAAQQNYIARFHRPHDRQASLFGRLLIYHQLLILKISGTISDALYFNDQGRPGLLLPDTDCNIAHSGEFVVSCVGFGYRTGIDIEKIKPIDFHGIAATVPQLTTLIPDCTASSDKFFDAWTMLEALLKAHGKGFGADIQINKTFDNSYQTGSELWSIEKIRLHKEYASHLAYSAEENSRPVIEINRIEIEELLQTSREMFVLAGNSIEQ